MPNDRNKRRYNAYLSPKHHEKAEQYMLDDPVLPNPDIRGAKQEFTEKAILNFLNIASSNTKPSDNSKQEWLLQEKQEQIRLLQQQVDDFRDRFNDITTDSAGRVYAGGLGSSPVFEDGRPPASEASAVSPYPRLSRRLGAAPPARVTCPPSPCAASSLARADVFLSASR